MKSKGKYITIGIVVILLLVLIGKYNSFSTSQLAVKNAESQVDNQLQRRNDLIPNLVNTVQGYAKHEQAVFDNVTKARQQMMTAGSTQEKSKADGELTSAVGRLLMIAENYPQLKANENFLALQTQLEGTENRISVARRDYNSAVTYYNTKLVTFPNNIIAGITGFKQAEYFKAQESAKTVPKVNFDSTAK